MIEDFGGWNRLSSQQAEPAAETIYRPTTRAEPGANEKDFWKACPIGIVGGARGPVKAHAEVATALYRRATILKLKAIWIF